MRNLEKPSGLVLAVAVALAACDAGSEQGPSENSTDEVVRDAARDDERARTGDTGTADARRPPLAIDPLSAHDAGGSAGGGAGGTTAASVAASGSGDDASLMPVDAAAVASADPDARATPPVFSADGEPLSGEQHAWTYTEFSETHCRDGSPAGIALNMDDSSKKLLIFLEGGGVCSNEQTCAINAPNTDDLISLSQTLLAATGMGIFDRSRAENPVRDWNFVYVPYCTGDRHAGANPDANVAGVGPQQFVGYRNLQSFLQRIVPTFVDTTDVVLAGTSAGGAGADRNAFLVQRAFPEAKVKVVNDSLPPLSKAVIAECSQEQWRTQGAYEQTFLAECGAACPNPNDYVQDYALFLAESFRDRPSGLISATEDWVERTLFGIGNEQCTTELDFLNPGISPSSYRAELLAHREKLKAFPNYGTFYIDGEGERSSHGWLVFDDFYTVTAGEVKLVDWFRKIVTGESPGHAGP